MAVELVRALAVSVLCAAPLHVVGQPTPLRRHHRCRYASQLARLVNASSHTEDVLSLENPEPYMLQVGYLLEELRDASNFKALQADVASANIFVGSLIFIEQLADKVGSAHPLTRSLVRYDTCETCTAC